MVGGRAQPRLKSAPAGILPAEQLAGVHTQGHGDAVERLQVDLHRVIPTEAADRADVEPGPVCQVLLGHPELGEEFGEAEDGSHPGKMGRTHLS